jgi:hypothetical protein
VLLLLSLLLILLLLFLSLLLLLLLYVGFSCTCPFRTLSHYYAFIGFRPLPDPYLVATTPAVAELVNISKELLQSDFFLSMFSGNRTEFSIFESDVIENDNGGQKTSDEGVTVLPSWATPYALSIYGQELYNNCPFGEQVSSYLIVNICFQK